MDYLDKITLDDLDDDQRQLAELLSLPVYVTLIRTYGGTYMYIPKPETISKNIRNEIINREFDGTNYKQLAKRHKLSEVTVRTIVCEKEQELAQQPLDGQLKLEL